MKKIAFFDIDKTIYNGYVIFPLAEYQLRKSIIDQSCFDALNNDLKLYKTGKVDYESTIAHLLDHWAVGLKGQNYQYILEETKNFFHDEGNKFYNFLEPLLQVLRPKYDIFFVTGETKFVGEATNLKFLSNGYISSKLELEDEIFNGEVGHYLAKRDEKYQAILSLLKEYEVESSLAFGDSEGDIQMLSAVGNAICINATDGLSKYARKNNWHITTPDEVVDLVETLIK